MAYLKGFRIYEPRNPDTFNPATDTVDPSQDTLVKELIEGVDYTTQDFNWEEIATATLQGGKKEYRYIVAFDDLNTGSPSPVFTVINIMPPSNITATAIEKDQIQIAFTDAEYQNGYKYRINGGTAFDLPVDKKIKTGLSAGQTYTIEIATKTASNDLSAWAGTNPVTVTTWATIFTPAVPTASNVTYNSITWDTADSQSGVVYIYEDNYGHSQTVSDSWTVTGLRYNTDYKARVRAYRPTSDEYSNWSEFPITATKTATNPSSSPKSPLRPVITVNSYSNGQGLRFDWNDCSTSGEDITYKIYDGSHNLLHTIPVVNQLYFNEIDSIQPNAPYTRYVTATNANGESEASLVKSVLTLPAKPTLLKGVSGQHVDYSWVGQTGIGVGIDGTENHVGTGYRLYQVGSPDVVLREQKELTWYQDGERKIQVYLVAFNATGESEHDPAVNVITVPNNPPTLTVTDIGTGYRLDWTNNSSILDGFKVQKRIKGNPTWTNLTPQFQFGASTLQVVDTFTIQPNTVYEYQVCAYVVGGGDSGWTISGLETISTPTVSGTVYDAQNKFRWDWGQISGAEAYEVVEKNEITGATTTYTYNKIASSPPQNWHEFTWVGSTVEKYYSITVRAKSTDSGYGTVYSGWSSQDTRVYSSPRIKPTNLLVVKFGTEFRLSWTDNSKVEKWYTVQRRLNGGAWTTVTTLGENVRTFNETIPNSGSNLNVLWEYQVIAGNVNGSTLPSDPYGYCIAIDKVVLTVVLDDINNKIDYSWTPNPIATGYTIVNTVTGDTFNNIGTNASQTTHSRSFIGETYETTYIIAENTTYNNIQSAHSNEEYRVSSPKNPVSNLSWVRSSNDIIFTWNDTSIVEDYFDITYYIGNTRFDDTVTSNSMYTLDTQYSYTVTLPDFKSELVFRIANKNTIGTSSYEEVTIVPAPSVFQGAYVADEDIVRLGFLVDGSITDQTYVVKYIIDSTQADDLTSFTISDLGVNKKYIAQTVPLNSGNAVTATVYAIVNGIEQLPSDPLVIDKEFYMPEIAPYDIDTRWQDEGHVVFSWTGSTDKAIGYRLIYTIYHEDSTNDGSVTIEKTATLGNFGSFSSDPILLVTGDTIYGQIQAFTLVDDGVLSDAISTTYYYIENPLPPDTIFKSRIENGINVAWGSLSYIDYYEVRYALNGVWQTPLKCDLNQIDILFDYSTTTSFQAYVVAHYLGGKTSIPSSSIVFTPVYKVQKLIGEIKNYAVNKINLMNGLIYTKCKVTNLYGRMIANKNLSKSYILRTYSVKQALQKDYVIGTLSYSSTSKTYQPVTLIHKLIKSSYYLNAKCFRSITNKNLIRTKICLFNAQTFYTDKYIVYNQVRTNQPFIPIIGNFGLKRKYTDFQVVYSRVAKPFTLSGYMYYKVSIPYLINSDIHKILVYTIGDSIFAGHPNWWAEAGNGTLLSGSGNPESQFQFWLDKRLGDSYEIFNKGKGSNTTTHIRNRFISDVVTYKPQYVIINGGTNDIAIVTANRAKNGWSDLVYQSEMNIALQTMKDNIVWMVNTALANKITPIITTLLPRSTAQPYPPERQALWDYNAWIISYANSRRNEKVYYVDFYNAGKDFLPPMPLEDPRRIGFLNPLYDGNTKFDEYGNIVAVGQGVHPNVTGFKIMGDSIPLALFEVKASTIKIYLDPECTKEETLLVDDLYSHIYQFTLTNMNRGRTKLTTRYIKNVGSTDLMYALYPTKETGADIKFSINGSANQDTVSKVIEPEAVHKIDITLAVPRIGETPEIKLELAMRTYKRILT